MAEGEPNPAEITEIQAVPPTEPSYETSTNPEALAHKTPRLPPFGPAIGVSFNQQPGAQEKFIDKMTSVHITAVLEEAGRDSERKFQKSLVESKYLFCICIAAIVLIFLLSWMFLHYNQPQLLERIIIGLIGLVSGAAGGFSVGRHFPSKKDKE